MNWGDDLNNIEFAERMKEIIGKASVDSDMTLDWQLVSSDPDVVADFGMDRDGNLVLDTCSYPLKITDITDVRYRWNSETDFSDCFYRFEFGENYMDVCFGDCGWTGDYHIKIGDYKRTCMSKKDIEVILKAYKDNKCFAIDKHNKLIWYWGEILDIEVPEGVESIEMFSFHEVDCRSIKLPKSVKTIGQRAFEDCKVSKIDLAEVEIIKDGAFSGCKNLKSVVIPASIKSIGEFVFNYSGINNLKQIKNLSDLELKDRMIG